MSDTQHDDLSAARLGDRAALERVLRDNYDYIYTLCRRICPSKESAEDATQNALISIAKGIRSFDGRSKFSTWAYRVATNSSLDELRRLRRVETVSLDSATFQSESEIGTPYIDAVDLVASRDPSVVPSGIGDPVDAVIASETRASLRVALDSIDERFRVPMVLRDVGGFDYAEIAEILGLAPGTVRSRISRARHRLAEILTDPASEVVTDIVDGTTGPSLTSE